MDKQKRIAALIAANLDGCSVTPAGNKSKAKAGYFVSLTNLTPAQPEQVPALLEYIQRKAAGLHLSRYYYGAWSNGKQYFIDLSILVRNRTKALQIAKDYNQQAIFDIAALESVYL